MTSKDNLNPLIRFNKLLEAQEKACTSKKRKSKARGKEVLLRPLTGECQGWAFHVPRCFNTALDITFNSRINPPCWEQGVSFNFTAGDIIHDADTEGITLWSDCLKVINRQIQIKRASSAGIGEDGIRYKGSVTFKLYATDEERKGMAPMGEFTTTQDNFIRFLISGELREDHDL